MHVLGDIVLPRHGGLPIFFCYLLDNARFAASDVGEIKCFSVDEARRMVRGYEAA